MRIFGTRKRVLVFSTLFFGTLGSAWILWLTWATIPEGWWVLFVVALSSLAGLVWGLVFWHWFTPYHELPAPPKKDIEG